MDMYLFNIIMTYLNWFQYSKSFIKKIIKYNNINILLSSTKMDLIHPSKIQEREKRTYFI